MGFVHTLFCLLVFNVLIFHVKTLTNQEFFDILEPYITDVEEVDNIGKDEVTDDADVIVIPGESDDELNVDLLVEKLGLGDSKEDNKQVSRVSSGGSFRFRRHRFRFRRFRIRPFHVYRPKVSVHCRKDQCSSCVTQKFKVVRKKFKLQACAILKYVRRDKGFELDITYNGRTLFHKEISVRKPRTCVHPLVFLGLCVEFSDFRPVDRHACLRLTGELKLLFKTFKLHIKLGCFDIPLLEENNLEEAMTSISSTVKLEVLPTTNTESDAYGLKDDVEMTQDGQGMQTSNVEIV